MKTVVLPIETDLFESVRAHLAQLITGPREDKQGDKVFVGVIKKQKKVTLQNVLKEWEERMGNAFTLTIAQSLHDSRDVRTFFAGLGMSIVVNWHADALSPEYEDVGFPIYVCLRHQRWEANAPQSMAGQPGFILAAFFSMDSSTLQVMGNDVRVCRDEINDDLDILALRYDYLP